jgi:hypothetical protein
MTRPFLWQYIDILWQLVDEWAIKASYAIDNADIRLADAALLLYINLHKPLSYK